MQLLRKWLTTFSRKLFSQKVPSIGIWQGSSVHLCLFYANCSSKSWTSVECESLWDSKLTGLQIKKLFLSLFTLFSYSAVQLTYYLACSYLISEHFKGFDLHFTWSNDSHNFRVGQTNSLMDVIHFGKVLFSQLYTVYYKCMVMKIWVKSTGCLIKVQLLLIEM